MQLDLSAELIDILNSRTRRLVVGLQLAAFIATFNFTNKRQFIQHFCR
ncbi:MAG: hypothetical protein IPG70_16475 [Moraxellaceae bacterium]|nr:hypothetical protein [Moraxellaceae bacterium]